MGMIIAIVEKQSKSHKRCLAIVFPLIVKLGKYLKNNGLLRVLRIFQTSPPKSENKVDISGYIA